MAKTSEDDVLAVLVDQDSGREYCVSLIDAFVYNGQEYSVMSNYRPGDGRHKAPEIVVMRSYRAKDGSRMFTSVRERRELEIVFELFYSRFRDAERMEKP